MFFTKKHKIILIAALLATLPSSLIATERENKEINDLQYGEALYHFYQQQYFSAITKLVVAKQKKPITTQGADPELLLGSLYLYYGLHEKASDIFNLILKQNSLQKTQDKAWFNIGKMQYSDREYNKAETSLLRVKDTLSNEREAERQNLLANTFMKQKKYPEALKAVKQLDDHLVWQSYAQYNLGVSFIKSGKYKDGEKFLQQISSLDTNNVELKALRDKTNIALGYAYIRNKQPESSIQYLEKVRLQGPLTANALLGIGWAQQQKNNLELALVPWLELRSRPVIDTAVQESLLAIPYTLERMGNKQLALQHYSSAIEQYKKELSKLNQVMIAVKNGELLNALKPAMITEVAFNPAYKSTLPNSISAPYLSHVLNSQSFKITHKNYLDLIFLQQNLIRWKNQLPAFNLMLNERKRRYRERFELTKNDGRLSLISKFQKMRNKLAIELNLIEKKHNVFALATTDEQDILHSLNKVQKIINKLSKDDDFSEEQEKFELLKGIMLWDLSTDYTPRYWKVKNELKQLDKAITTASSRLKSLVLSSKNAPATFKGFADRIKEKKQKVDTLLKQITFILHSQENYIVRQALEALQQRYHQIENYHIRARYSLARLYDSMTLSTGDQ